MRCIHNASYMCPTCYDEYVNSEKEQLKMGTNLHTRYTNGIEDYCIHGMSMTSKCDYCKEIREQEIRDMEQVKMNCRCAKCDINFASITDYQKHKCGMENKMTREEAIEIVNKYGFLDSLEKLGLLKFDEPKKKPLEVVNIHRFAEKYNGVRIEEWSEGLVLWVGGEIKWKSWINSVPDLVVIEARKYVNDCKHKPYESSQAFMIIGDHFMMLEKLLEYVEKKKRAD